MTYALGVALLCILTVLVGPATGEDVEMPTCGWDEVWLGEAA